MERPDFRIEVSSVGTGTVVLRVAGEVDVCSSFSFREQLVRAVAGGAASMVVDLSEVSLIDTTSLKVVEGVARRLFLEARELIVVCPEGRLRRVLASAGLDRLVPVLPAREDLIAHPVNRSPWSPKALPARRAPRVALGGSRASLH